MQEIIEQLKQERSIESVLNHYARACDERDWNALASVFSETAQVNYGNEFKLQGRKPIVDMVRSMLGGCGPTQHLLGNFEISVSNTQATCKCYVRAVHAGVGPMLGEYYEVWAQYHDVLLLSNDTWQIVEREMAVHHEVGDRAVLQPE